MPRVRLPTCRRGHAFPWSTRMPVPAIEVVNLEKIYTRRRAEPVRAVDGLTFSIAPGSIFGLLGPNGAGKTTTLKILTTLIKPTSGQRAHPRHRRRRRPAQGSAAHLRRDSGECGRALSQRSRQPAHLRQVPSLARRRNRAAGVARDRAVRAGVGVQQEGHGSQRGFPPPRAGGQGVHGGYARSCFSTSSRPGWTRFSSDR